MALRIGEYVVAGEINNSRRNSIDGWIAWGEDDGVRLNLTGNLRGDLAGKHFRFSAVQLSPVPDGDVRKTLDGLNVCQIGTIGTIVWKMTRVVEGSVEEFYQRARQGDLPPTAEKPTLYIEWFSQNGNIIAEVVDPVLEFDPQPEDDADVAPEPLPDPEASGGPSISGFALNDESGYDELSYDQPDREQDDPFSLFPPDLQSQLQLTDAVEEEIPYPDDLQPRPLELRPWDEVIPGIDPETKRMYEDWDEVTYGTKDEPITTLFDPPLTLKSPDHIFDEETAEEELQVLLARLALCSVAIDMCEHATALETYRWLMEDILPSAGVHPRLPSIGFVQHYSTWESCPQCAAEFEAKYPSANYDDDRADDDANDAD